MLVSLDRNGRVVQSGEGTFRVPMGADEVDNTLSSPVSAAEALEHRNRVEYATMAARAEAAADQDRAAAAHAAYLQNLASDYEEWTTEEATAENGGENPLLYLAAMQTMAGGATEMHSPLGGYLLSQDGQIDYPRAMSGRIMSSMGQSVQSLIQSAQSAASQAQSAIQAATGSSAAAPAPAATSILPPELQALMSQKIAGIPVPYLAGGLLLYLLLKK